MLSRMDRVRCSLWRRACSAATPLGHVAHAGHEAVPARGGGDGDVDGHRAVVGAPRLRLDLAGGRRDQPRDQVADVAADEVGQAAAEEPLRGRIGGLHRSRGRR